MNKNKAKLKQAAYSSIFSSNTDIKLKKNKPTIIMED